MKIRKKTLILGIAVTGTATLLPTQGNARDMQSPTSLEEATDSIVGAMYDDLGEVVVTGVRPIVTTDGATTTYNVDDDPGAAGVSLLDMLRKVPMVSVDAEDKILLKGESNYKILVNGKEDPTLSANASKLLKMMPAGAVAKIEVITEPGAKYDAEGTGGIINLITTRNQKNDGYTIGAQAYFNNRMSGGGVNGRLKHNKVTIGANVDYANGMYNPTETKKTEETLYLNPITGGGEQVMNHTFSQKSGFHYFGGGLKLSWEPTENDLISTDISINKVKGDLKNAIEETTMSEVEAGPNGNWYPGKLLWTSRSALDGTLTNLSTSALLSYQHNFSGHRHYLALSYQFSFGRSSFNTVTQILSQTAISNPLLTGNNTLSLNREHTVQFDYTNDFQTDKHLLETGAKLIMRHNGAHGVMSTGESENELMPDPDNRSNLTQLQDVYALYASYTGTYDNMNVKAGVRYEHTRMGNRYHWGEMTDFTRNLNDVVPNAAISYSFGPAQNLRLAYQMRISRPTVDQINPYLLSVTTGLNQQGNPDLRSEHSNNVSLTYSQFCGRIGGSIGVEYSQIDNCITNYIVTEGDLLISTYANLGKKRGAALNGFLNWSIIPRMSLSVNGRVEYINLKSRSPFYSNHGFQGNIGANWSYTLLSDWNFSAYGGTSLHNISLQGSSSGWHYYGIAVNKKILRDRSLTIGVSLNNFLEKQQRYTSTYKTHDSSTKSTVDVKNWNIGLNLSWTFGNLSQDVKHTSATINNDDVSSAKGGEIMSK
ncbi:MAG: TonB-dependent receptor [Bacteroidales bacterium]|nr:TonB-dependent receptor [Bacteroidales bacterium]